MVLHPRSFARSFSFPHPPLPFDADKRQSSLTKNLNAKSGVISGPLHLCPKNPNKFSRHDFLHEGTQFFTSFSYSYRHSLDTQGARSATSWIPPTRAAGRPPPCVPAAEPESATRALPILSLHAVVLLTIVYFHIYLACVPYKGTTCRSTLRQPSDTIKISMMRYLP